MRLCRSTGIRQKRICSQENKEVPYKQVVKGYEVREGEYVMLSQAEVDAAAGERSRLIDLEAFVRGDEIDPVFYDRAYYLGAGRDGKEGYRLLHDALVRSGRVGIGRWVFHNREYMVAVRPHDEALALQTMRFADELIDPDTLDLPQPSRTPGKREIEMAQTLVDSLHEQFRPDTFEDSYRERVLALIEAKARGEQPELEDVKQEGETPDVMAALEASLSAAGSRGKRSRKPARKRNELDDGGPVVVSDLELQAIEPRKTRTIDIEQFIDLADVDPIYLDHPYFLVPRWSAHSRNSRAVPAVVDPPAVCNRLRVGSPPLMDELYQAEWCPHSRRVRQRLTELGVSYIARPVPADRAHVLPPHPVPARRQGAPG